MDASKPKPWYKARKVRKALLIFRNLFVAFMTVFCVGISIFLIVTSGQI
jgi:hypothetical protein